MDGIEAEFLDQQKLYRPANCMNAYKDKAETLLLYQYTNIAKKVHTHSHTHTDKDIHNPLTLQRQPGIAQWAPYWAFQIIDHIYMPTVQNQIRHHPSF